MRRWTHRLCAIALFCSLLILPGKSEEIHEPEAQRLLAHYMPWYASKPFRGKWGWHWTMDHFDPDQSGPDGRPQKASHDEPLIGLYDSGDPHVLEYQVLQMKLTGIHGVIIDWYGTRDFYDYQMIHENTQALIPWLEKAGLSFAICYEDQSIGHMVKGGALPEDQAVDHAQEVFRWMEENWFSRDSYLREEDRPVLLTFGPQYFEPEPWKEALSAFTTDPWIHALYHLAHQYEADGAFGWPPVYGGKAITPETWGDYLQRLYDRADEGERVIGVAFPGFEDIYAEADLHESYGSIDSRDGRTFSETLNRALDIGVPLIQIATWNDYGEGTVIEPTHRHEFRYLEEIQRRMKPGASPRDLRLPLQLFQARMAAPESEEVQEAADLLFEGRLVDARQALRALKTTRESSE